MQYKIFGNTGIQISTLGFGAMRLPTIGEEDDAQVDLEKAVPLLKRGLDLGINYIDTAWMYLNQTSEIAVGKAIEGYDREKIYIATKNMIDTDLKAWRERLDIQLQRLNTDYIDFYHIHGLQWRVFRKKAVPEGYMKALEQARSEGLIRHISFSCHDSPQNLMHLIDTGEFSSMLVQNNLLHRMSETAIDHAHQKGMGVAIMGPVGGGRIEFLSHLKPREGRTISELALRYVISNPAIHVALSGMNTIEMIEENVNTADNIQPLTQIETEDIDQMLEQLKGLEDLYCTGCDYCMPCPNGVNIPVNFMFMNYDRFYDFSRVTDYRKLYNELLKPAGASADSCADCEECVEKCPQNIPIPDRMQDVAAHFAAEDNT